MLTTKTKVDSTPDPIAITLTDHDAQFLRGIGEPREVLKGLLLDYIVHDFGDINLTVGFLRSAGFSAESILAVCASMHGHAFSPRVPLSVQFGVAMLEAEEEYGTVTELGVPMDLWTTLAHKLLGDDPSSNGVSPECLGHALYRIVRESRRFPNGNKYFERIIREWNSTPPDDFNSGTF